MTELIPDAWVMSALERVANSRPGYVYNSGGLDCRYCDEDGDPSCIVGHALDELNMLDRIEWSMNEASIESIGDVFPEISDDARFALRQAQTAQDRPGGTWADALQQAQLAMGVAEATE